MQNSELAISINDLIRQLHRSRGNAPISLEGVTPAQFGLLRAMDHFQRSPGPPWAQGDCPAHNAGEPGIRVNILADLLNQAPPGISQRASELEAMGLIARKQSEHDRRATYICFTEKGEAALKTAKENAFNYAAQIVEAMGQKEAQQLIHSIKLYLAAAEKVAAGQKAKRRPSL